MTDEPSPVTPMLGGNIIFVTNYCNKLNFEAYRHDNINSGAARIVALKLTDENGFSLQAACSTFHSREIA